MAIVRVSFNRIPYLGVFALTTDKIALLPERFHVREQLVLDALGVRVVRTSLGGSPLIGVLATGNSRALVCSDLLELSGRKGLAESGVKVVGVPGRFTAFGNLVLANDRGALANPDLPDDLLNSISKVWEFL